MQPRPTKDTPVLTMVNFDYSEVADENVILYETTFPKDDVFLFMGEIPQMPGHCSVASFKTGILISGYHTDSFYILSNDDLTITIST